MPVAASARCVFRLVILISFNQQGEPPFYIQHDMAARVGVHLNFKEQKWTNSFCMSDSDSLGFVVFAPKCKFDVANLNALSLDILCYLLLLMA